LLWAIDAGSSSDPSKKRKATEAPAPKIPPAKKASTSAGPAVTVKKEGVAKTEAAAVKTAKSDSSFFSAPKKKSLPSFTKKTPVKKDETVAQPSSIDPFLEAYNAMTGGSVNTTNAAVPSTSSAPAVASISAAVSVPTNGMAIDEVKKPADPLKRKKSVSFAPDGELEVIRWITRAEYPEDSSEVCYYSALYGCLLSCSPQPLHGLSHAKALDRDEGRALHAQILQEVIDWYDPPGKLECAKLVALL